MSEDIFQVPQDLTLVNDQELQDLQTQAVAEFDRVNAIEDLSTDDIAYAGRLADDIDRVRAELQVRAERVKQQAQLAKAKAAEQQQLLSARVHGKAARGEADEDGDAGDEGAPSTEAIAAAAAKGTAAALVAMLGERGGADLVKVSERATASLAAARRFAPAIVNPPKAQLVVTASVDIPGVATGSELPSLDAVVDAFQKRARGLPVSQSGRSDAGPRVVTIRNQFEHTVDDRTSPAQIDELLKHLITKENQEALVAGGGWCAPSEIRYDFFNIACEDGAIDLPTVGISRGGIRFPVSPSLADTGAGTGIPPFDGQAFTNASNPWLWTETDDQATVTGAPNKPCVRVPCPTFDERRLECYGICLTAGNLTDDAYPEATANFLRLLMSAHAHAMNRRIIETMVTLSSAIVSGGDFNGAGGFLPVYNQVLGGVALAATDYRTRFGMCDDDVLEVVIPRWVAWEIQADLAWRRGAPELLAVTMAQINGYFAARNIRVQWVNDWQVYGGGQFGADAAMTAWPTSVDVMIYAAGTFLLGNGLTLDLGVVRDSVLNAENDHTAAWSEECHLVARVGHESRQYRIGFAVNGAASADVALGHNL